MNKLKRFAILVDIGCIACVLDGRHGTPPDIHHLVEGRKRLGDDHTIPLCPWHHRGVPCGSSAKETEEVLGPSLARNKREFVERYGTERELLEMVNEIIRR